MPSDSNMRGVGAGIVTAFAGVLLLAINADWVKAVGIILIFAGAAAVLMSIITVGGTRKGHG